MTDLFDCDPDAESFSDDIIDDICQALDDDSLDDDFDLPFGFPDCSMDQSRGSDLCPDGSLMHGHKSPGDNNNEWSTAHDFLREKNHLVKLKADPQQKNKRSDKPRKRRQNITRRPGETDAQLKERRYQAKLKRNRESGVRARKRRQNEAGLLRTEHGQLLEQIHAKRLILRRLEQENAHLQQLLISERAANHPLFRNSGSPRKQGRRSQQPQAPPLTMFAVAFVALLTWSATLESSSLYDAHVPSSKVRPRVRVFQAGVPASFVNPAAEMALQPLLEYTLQLQQQYWHLLIKFVQLMALFLISVCFLGLYPSLAASITGARPKSRVVSVHSTRSKSVSFTSSPTRTKRVHDTRQRHVITYII